MTRTELGDPRDVAAMATRAGVGLAVLAVAWYQVADEVALERQTGWVALGAGGVVASSVAIAMWLLQLRRTVSGRLATVRAKIEMLPIDVQRSVDGGALVRVEGPDVRRYHRSNCELVVGKATTTGSRESLEAQGTVACGVCIDV